MLRITESSSADAARHYFTSGLKQGDYYVAGAEQSGIWGGKAASMLGLKGHVKEEDFQGLLDNRRPDGSKLTLRMDRRRRPGYDFTFDVPKSVSLLHTVGQDERIPAAMHRAAIETMSEIEKEMHTRVRRGGKDEDRCTGNMLWASFTHTTSRPAPLSAEQRSRCEASGLAAALPRDAKGAALVPDPHLHVHVYALNATFDAEEKRWKAGVFMQAKRDASYYQAAYHTRLAQELQRLGYAVQPTKHAFEVVGVRPELLVGFSRRTREVEEEAARSGITDPEQKAALGAKTRRAKTAVLNAETLGKVWQAMTPQEDLRLVQRCVSEARMFGFNDYQDSAQAAEEGIAYAFEKELERSSTVSERRLLAAALAQSVGKATVETVRHALEQHPELLRGSLAGEVHVSTREVLAEEDELLELVRTSHAQGKALVPDKYVFQNPLFSTPAASEQRDAIEQLFSTQRWTFGLIGRAGTGKTTLLKEVEAGLQKIGVPLVAVAPTSEAARGVLRTEGFTSADTVKRMLVDEKFQTKLKGAVLWVDEAGMLGNRDLLGLLRLAKLHGAAKVVLAGDPTQIRSVPRGDALRFLQENAGLKVARLERIQRQKSAKLKAVIEAISRGKVEAGLRQLQEMKAIHEAERDEIHARLARDYVDRLARKKSALAVCPTHKEGHAVTQAIRAELLARRMLGPQAVSVLRTVSLRLNEAERGQAASYERGQVIQFLRSAPGFKRGERATVESVAGGQVLLRTNAGKLHPLPLHRPASFDVFARTTLEVRAGERLRITQNSQEGAVRYYNGSVVTVAAVAADGSVTLADGKVLPPHFGHLAHAYVSTADSAQAKTVDSVFVAIGSDSLGATEARRTYVALSRARHEAAIYTDDAASMIRAAARSTQRHFARDLLARRRRRTRVQSALGRTTDNSNHATPSHRRRYRR